MNIHRKIKVENLLKEILQDFIPHIDMILYKYKQDNYETIFWFYKEKMESFCHLMNYCYNILKSEKKEETNKDFIKKKLYENNYNFSTTKEINFYTTLLILKKIKEIIFLPIIYKIKENFSKKKIFTQILISTKKLVFLNRFLESVITFDKNDIFGIHPKERKNCKNWNEFKDNFHIVILGEKEEMIKLKNEENKTTILVMNCYINSNECLLDLENKQELKKHLDDKKIEKEIKKLKVNKKKIDNVSKLNSKFFRKSFSLYLETRKKENKNKFNEVINEIELFNAFPKSEVITQMWNITETKLAKVFRNLTLKKIGTNKKFYLHPSLFNKFFPEVETSDFSKLMPKCLKDPKKLYFDDLLNKNTLEGIKDKELIRIRLLYYKNINLNKKINKLISYKTSKIKRNKKRRNNAKYKNNFKTKGKM